MSESIQLLRMYMTHDEIMCIAFLAMIYPNLGEKLINMAYLQILILMKICMQKFDLS